MLLFFDLDDTLVDSNRAYADGMRAIGIDPKNPMFLKARTEVKELLGQGAPSARSRTLYFKRMLEFEGRYSALRHLELVSKYEDAVIKSIKTQWLDLKRDILFATLSSKHRLFIITNETTRMQALKLQAMDPHGKYFSGMLTSEEAGIEKPDERIFNLALQRCKSSPDQCIMIGDSHINDVEPAIRLGMRVFRTTEFVPAGDETAQGFEYLSKLDHLTDLIN